MGGEPAIHIRVEETQRKKALTILKGYNCTLTDDEIRVFTANPWEIMNEASNKLSSQGVSAEKVEIVEPTLEGVFIKLTGRRLTEIST